MLLVMTSEGLNYFNSSIIPNKGNVQLESGVGLFDVLKEILRNLGVARGVLKELLRGLQKGHIFSLRKTIEVPHK